MKRREGEEERFDDLMTDCINNQTDHMTKTNKVGGTCRQKSERKPWEFQTTCTPIPLHYHCLASSFTDGFIFAVVNTADLGQVQLV